MLKYSISTFLRNFSLKGKAPTEEASMRNLDFFNVLYHEEMLETLTILDQRCIYIYRDHPVTIGQYVEIRIRGLRTHHCVTKEHWLLLLMLLLLYELHVALYYTTRVYFFFSLLCSRFTILTIDCWNRRILFQRVRRGKREKEKVFSRHYRYLPPPRETPLVLLPISFASINRYLRFVTFRLA